MEKKIEKLMDIHSKAFMLWKHTHEATLEPICHQILHQLMEHLSTDHPHVQTVMLKNCIILAHNQDYTPIAQLLQLLEISINNNEDVFVPLANRLRIMLG